MRTVTKSRRALEELITTKTAELDESRLNYVRSSWLPQILEARTRVNWYSWSFLVLRFMAVAGGLVLPVLASQGLGDVARPNEGVRLATFVVSVFVAISAAATQVFRFGTEWALDEEYSNGLEAEGWAYFQGAGPYREISHDSDGAYQQFFARIEELRQLRSLLRISDIRVMAADASKEPPAPPSTPRVDREAKIP